MPSPLPAAVYFWVHSLGFLLFLRCRPGLWTHTAAEGGVVTATSRYIHLDTAYEYRCSGIAAGQQGEVAQVGDGIFGQGQVVRGEVEGGGGGELNQGS